MSNDATLGERALWVIAIGCGLVSAYYAIAYSAQPILEQHGFRQAQIALTAHGFVVNGYKLIYDTPVAGAPWAIPFELPIYQAVVALTRQLTAMPLTVIGRLVSFICVLLCVFPARRTFALLGLPRVTLPVFAALLWSSPLQLFWGRAFMVETMAALLATAAVPFVLTLIIDPRDRLAPWFATALLSAAMLQKPTTAVPLALVLVLVWLVAQIRNAAPLAARMRGAMVFAVPFGLSFAWTALADHAKLANRFGAQLTSQALHDWTYGNNAQRFSADLWHGVAWSRVLEGNCAGWIGVILFLAGLVAGNARSRALMIAGASAGAVALLLYPNLHIVHDYDQVAFAAFVIASLAVAVVVLAARLRSDLALVVLVFLVVGSNYSAFANGYLPLIQKTLTWENNRTLALGTFLRAHTTADEPLVVFGNEWGGEIAFYSERRTFTVPEFFIAYDEAIAHPERFVDGPPRAVVVCPSKRGPDEKWVNDQLAKTPTVSAIQVHDCWVVMSEKNP